MLDVGPHLQVNIFFSRRESTEYTFSSFSRGVHIISVLHRETLYATQIVLQVIQRPLQSIFPQLHFSRPYDDFTTPDKLLEKASAGGRGSLIFLRF